MVIPNSVLNTAALTKLTPVSEGMATLEFTAKASGDPSAISQDILDRVTKATADVALEGQPPLVKFTGFSPYGMTGPGLVFARCLPPSKIWRREPSPVRAPNTLLKMAARQAICDISRLASLGPAMTVMRTASNR